MAKDLFGTELYFLREGDKVLTDQMGFVISKKDFDFMISQVYETYQELTDERIEAYNEAYGKKHFPGLFEER